MTSSVPSFPLSVKVGPFEKKQSMLTSKTLPYQQQGYFLLLSFMSQEFISCKKFSFKFATYLNGAKGLPPQK